MRENEDAIDTDEKPMGLVKKNHARPKASPSGKSMTEILPLVECLVLIMILTTLMVMLALQVMGVSGSSDQPSSPSTSAIKNMVAQAIRKEKPDSSAPDLGLELVWLRTWSYEIEVYGCFKTPTGNFYYFQTTIYNYDVGWTVRGIEDDTKARHAAIKSRHK
jgi:hypothetical protein